MPISQSKTRLFLALLKLLNIGIAFWDRGRKEEDKERRIEEARH